MHLNMQKESGKGFVVVKSVRKYFKIVKFIIKYIEKR